MLRRLAATLIVVTAIHGTAYAQATTWDRYVSVGGTFGGLTGDGTGTNKFDLAPSGYLDYGTYFGTHWGITLLSTGYGPTKNKVGSSSIGGSIYTPYAGDIRWRAGRGRTFTPVVALGMGWRRMKFDRMKGWSNYGVASLGVGAQLRVGSSGLMLETFATPYIAFKNDLGQTTGFDVRVGLGRSW